MRKFAAYTLAFPAVIFLAVGMSLMALTLSVAGGRRGVSILNKAFKAFISNLKV